MAKVNWAVIETEYLTDETQSYEKLAKKYGVNEFAVYKQAKANNWQEKRKESLAKVSQKLVEKGLDKVVDFQIEKLKIGKFMVGIGIEKLNTTPPRNAREAKEIIEVGYKLMTQAMGLDKADIDLNMFVDKREQMLVADEKALTTILKIYESLQMPSKETKGEK